MTVADIFVGIHSGASPFQHFILYESWPPFLLCSSQCSSYGSNTLRWHFFTFLDCQTCGLVWMAYCLMIFDDLAVPQFPTDPVRLQMTFTNHPPQAAGSRTPPHSSFKVMPQYRWKEFPQVLTQNIVHDTTQNSFIFNWHIDWEGIETYGSSKKHPPNIV